MKFSRFAGLSVLSLLFAAFLAAAAPDRAVFDVRSFGAKGDGATLDTRAINDAIAAAAESGGTVVFPAGRYLSHSIRLKSHVGLQLEHGAVIVAADPPKDGGPGYDAAEPNPTPEYQDFGHSHWHNSLIWGENLEDVSITGPGQIYGRGLSRGTGRVALPVNVTAEQPKGAAADVLRADGNASPVDRPDLKPGPFGYPNARDTLQDGVGNKAIALKNCRNVVFRDFTILHGGHFGILATGVDNFTLDNLVIDTNRDGMDIDACSNVRVSNCSVNSPWDDGICLKASYGLNRNRATENVTITNCFVSGYDEGTLLDGTRQRRTTHKGGPIGRIKLGTEANGGFRNIAVSNCVFEYCRGLALEQVDGGVMEDIAVTNLAMRDIVNAPVFVRLGARLRGPEGTPMGSARRILLSNIVAYNVAPDHGVFISGVPGHPIEDLTLSGIRLYFRGGGTAEQAARAVPEMEKGYPEPDLFGVLPSWGVFARHAANLVLRDVQLHLLASDARPAVSMDDVAGVELVDVRVERTAAQPFWRMNGVTDVLAVRAAGVPDAGAAK
ncbi:exo-poly-alpha-D-galacturonosidase [Opitutaceae bacterium EW11]|nr:exo-poly-alpha-D-galacturonosidase [Opitutaceae bacterium EW11]